MSDRYPSIEQKRYEIKGLWDEDAYTTPFELARVSACVDMIPEGVRTVLDAGAGNGAFLRLLETSRTDIEPIGVERSRSAISASLCKANIYEGSIDRLSFEDNHFDLVSSLNVIEHLPFEVYEKSILELSRTADQYVLISVPFREKRLDAICSYCGCRFNPHFHMRSFDEESLNNLIPGFRLIGSRKIKRRESIIEVLALPFRRTVFSRFPEKTACPQCGYSLEPALKNQENEFRPKPKEHLFKRIVRKCISLFPSVRVTRTIVLLYEKEKPLSL